MYRSSLVLAILLIVPALAGTASSQVNPIVEATSAGQANVGFDDGFLPDVDVGGTLAGYDVLRVIERGAVITVAAESLTRLRLDLQGYPGIAYIEDDPLRYATLTPDDPRYSDQWGPGHMGFPSAWGTVGYGSNSIKVAVLDTGVLRSHEDFESSRMLQGWDYVNNDNDPDDDCDHGTHVAGTVAATTDNGLGVAGMSQATILPMKVLAQSVWGCSGSDSGIADAIYDATDQGAHVISMSLGSAGGSTTIHDAVIYASNNGVLVVAAAGNDGSSNSVDYPAAFDEVIAVAALESTGGIASYSDRGPEVEISAPGSDIWSTWGDGGYNSIDGTSMATPHVSGALALALSCDSSLTASELRTMMQDNAEDLGSQGRDNTYGFGLLRIDTLVNAIGTCGGGGGNNPPTASFTYTTSDLTVSVDGSGSSDPDGDALTYSWDFGDGGSGSGVTASHTYSSGGTYTVTLTVDDGNGGSDSASQSVTVSTGGGDPILESGVSQSGSLSGTGAEDFYRIDVPSGATQLEVVLDGPAGSDFDLYTRQGARPSDSTYDCRPYTGGSDETCTHANPAQGWWYVRVDSYSGSGSYTVTATVTGGSNQGPTASFTASCTDLTCDFDASGSSDPDGDALTYSWDFGDGASGSGVAPSHTYSSGGTYTVTLTVDDGNGGTDTATQSVSPTDPPVNQDPTASFTASCTDLTCDFDGSGSSDPDGDALTYSWDFGDGASGSGVTPSHTYGSAGTYTVTLTVDDGNGGTGAASQDVSPTEPAGDPILESGVSQSGSLSGTGAEDFYRIDVSSGATQLEVVLDGPAGSDFDLYTREGARPSDSVYDCRPYTGGSDETCTHANPAQGWWYVRVDSYSGSGSYTITATVTTGGGNGDPTASFTASCTDLTCDFDASGSSDPDGDALTYSWDFGDGGSGSGLSPSHTYGSGGTYTVTLTVDDGNGGSDSASQSVTVSSDPDPGTPTMENGVTQTVTLTGPGDDEHLKIYVPAGTSTLTVVMDGPACVWYSCPLDADLYVRHGARATDTAYDCRPYEGDSDETCTISSPAEGWWYVRLDSYSGSGDVDVTASF